MTIAVIGHGRSPEGKGWGPLIDSCQFVVRMWDWFGWQRPEDYGKKYDYGLFVITPKGLFIFWRDNVAKPKHGWLGYHGKVTHGALPERTEILATDRWTASAAALGGVGESGRLTLTRGCAAAAWAIEQHADSPPGPNKVVLVGFDNVRDGINRPIDQSFAPEYWKIYMARFLPDVDKVYPIGSSKTATHDMAVELPLLQRLAKQHNVELCFAQDIWCVR